MTKLFREFFESEKSGGLVLLFCTLLSLVISNSFLGTDYLSFWNTNLGSHTTGQWVNDGLMAIFFLLIGLELEREIYIGELSKIKDALLPFSAAVGGMLIPAALFFFLNFNTKTQSGFGIPMATDIAFALGILSLLGNKVPTSLKVMLTALAVIDDLGAILVIALFYTKSLIWTNLIISLAIFGVLLILNRLKVRNLIPYLVGGVFMWYFMLNSGIHATITGVLLAFAIPFGNGDEKSTSYVLQHALHKPVAYIILPIFALANTAIIIESGWQNAMTETYTLGILIGLLFGKPIGIMLFSYLAVKLKWCSLPSDINWKMVLGIGLLAGIGFTMSIFITLLAYDDNYIINNTKIMIIIASTLAGIAGFLLLKTEFKKID